MNYCFCRDEVGLSIPAISAIEQNKKLTATRLKMSYMLDNSRYLLLRYFNKVFVRISHSIHNKSHIF